MENKTILTFHQNARFHGLMTRDSIFHCGHIPLQKPFLGYGALQLWVINMTYNMPGFRLNHKDGQNTSSSYFCLDFLLAWVVSLDTNFFTKKKCITRFLEHGATPNSCTHISLMNILKVITKRLVLQLTQQLPRKIRLCIRSFHSHSLVLT